MKLNGLVPACLAALVVLLLGGFIALRCNQPDRSGLEQRAVYVERTDTGFRLIRNGEPFVIRGAGGDAYFRELAEIGGNTIRVFDAANLKEKLNEAHRHGLAVIVDIYIPHYSKAYNLYADEVENDRLKQQIRALVREHKDHPALLIWNLGNEVNYPLVLRKNDFIRTFNELVEMIQEEDPDHPVSTSIIGAGRKTMISIFLHSPGLDIVSFNTFGNTMFVNRHVAQVSLLFGSRPYMISELGPNGPWESYTTAWGAPIEAKSSIKSELYLTRSKMVSGDSGSAHLGSLVFYWGEKLERTHTWFSLFREGRPSTRVRMIEAMWNPDGSSESPTSLDCLSHLLLNQKVAADNIVLYPGQVSHAEVFLHDHANHPIRVEWEIYPEAWFSDTHPLIVGQYRPLDTFVAIGERLATFLAPSREGPYRIFVYIHHVDGTFETTNMPFYVLERTAGL